MRLPENVRMLMARLRQAGYTAYAVGGCVRDTLMNRVPKDWDLCTSALPADMQRVFAGERVLETGLKHGTLTVILGHEPYEITTYRVDGAYTDHRHPDAVSFVDRVDGDLSRRDFTINAMACGEDGAVLDFFGGREDLKAGIIRCVGDPEKRFGEDALRIMRALRFASRYDFAIEPETDRAIRSLYPTLDRVAGERIRVELLGMLTGPGVGRMLRAYPEVLTFLIPCLKEEVGYDQKNPHHLFTLWEHTVRAVEEVPPDEVLRMTMLMHDCGKPAARITDEKGIGHYPGHQAISARLTAPILEKYRFDRASSDRILRLVEAHDIPLSPDRKTMLRRLNRFGEEDLRALFDVHRADRIATGTRSPAHARERTQELNDALDALLREHPCFSRKDLAVNGHDLMALGFSGADIGRELDRLLEAVMDGQTENTREALLAESAKRRADS
ncbi:MAG: HD domain-containing protein [Clostridia bacterium]|nr:HD domain-containing protein [Clostridia bacterium]